MNRIDYDLFSIQEARILVENGREAQRLLAAFSQEKLDAIVEAMAEAVFSHAKELAVMSVEETGFGKWKDKYVKNIFASRFLCQRLKGMKVVGVIAEDTLKKTMDIGIPVGVIAALPPATSPASTTIYKTLIAIKSGNAIVFSPHPRAAKTIAAVLDMLIQAGEENGLPEGAVSYLRTVTASGTQELINHHDTSLILITGVPKWLQAVRTSGKPAIYGGPGNGPAFIEQTAVIPKAVHDIVLSRSFDNGIVAASEQSIVAEGCIAEDVRQELKKNGAYFMTDEESERLGKALFHIDGTPVDEYVGRSAVEIAYTAGIAVPENTVVLISEQKYVAPSNPYAREKLCPVLAFYVERDWMNACEKCIELLFNEGLGNTLVIHSQDESLIRQFALKKPVSRMLVNTPATLGGIGATTNLFPAFTLGCGAAGGTITSDNVSPLNLINIRKVGYGVRKIDDVVRAVSGQPLAALQTDAIGTAAVMAVTEADVGRIVETIVNQLNREGIY
jgi:acetaldehyde dehydrogenase (acetylating)